MIYCSPCFSSLEGKLLEQRSKRMSDESRPQFGVVSSLLIPWPFSHRTIHTYCMISWDIMRMGFISSRQSGQIGIVRSSLSFCSLRSFSLSISCFTLFSSSSSSRIRMKFSFAHFNSDLNIFWAFGSGEWPQEHSMILLSRCPSRCPSLYYQPTNR